MAAAKEDAAAGVSLVVNLTRLGDLLQSQALITDLHRRGRRVQLVCLDNFADALSLLRHVERAWPLPGAQWLAALDRDWRGAAGDLLAWTRRVREVAQPQEIINLTTTLPARLLTRLLAGSDCSVRGFDLDAEGFGRNNGVWASFLNGTTAGRLNAPFNLVDMFRMLGAPKGTASVGAAGDAALRTPSEQTRLAALALLAAAPAESRGFVGLQLGASEARRQWPVRHFAVVGDQLWRELRLCPVLLGAPAETSLAQEYADLANAPFCNATGRTDLPQLAAVLTQLRLLITNDTGTMHLAAGLGVPSLALFLATAQPWDTGPYLPACCCLEPALDCHPCPYNRPCPHNLECHERISPAVAGALALSWCRTGRWEDAPLARNGGEVRIWLSRRDVGGFMDLRDLAGREGEDRSLWMRQQRHFWRHILDDMDRPVPSPLPPCPVTACSPPFAHEVGAALEQAVTLLQAIAAQGALTGKSPRAGALLLRNCERLQNLLNGCPPLAALGGFWRELRQAKGDDIAEFLQFSGKLAVYLEQWRQKLQGLA